VVEDISQEQIKQVAERALVIERYILKRAWGLSFALSAAETGLVTFLPLFFVIFRLSSDVGFFVIIGINAAISLAELIVVSWIFKKAYNAMMVRREIADSIWTKLLRLPWSIIIWGVYIAVDLTAFFFLFHRALDIIFGLLVTAIFPLYFALKVSFPERLPHETKYVLATFAICSSSSLIISLLGIARTFPYLVIWGIMFVMFLWASISIYRQKPPIRRRTPQSGD
jgi:hypothetical protein